MTQTSLSDTSLQPEAVEQVLVFQTDQAGVPAFAGSFVADLDTFQVRRPSYAEQNRRIRTLLCEEDPFQRGRDIPYSEFVWEGYEHPIAQMHAAEAERLRRLDDPEGAEKCLGHAEHVEGAAAAGWFDE